MGGCLGGRHCIGRGPGRRLSVQTELKTLTTLEKIDDNVLYTMKYDGDYGFDDFLLTGASTDGSWSGLRRTGC